MESHFWKIFAIASFIKGLLIAAPFSTDFEVHRNWLAITHSLPMNKWYVDATSEWTLDYPPFFAYFEWLLSQVAKFVDSRMLIVENLNYASTETIFFQRLSVILMDFVFALGVQRCFRALGISKKSHNHFTGELLLLLNVGLIFVDHIHFQYNGFLYGILLLSFSFLLEHRYLLAAFTFAALLNFKHIFLYMAPAYAAYLLKFYCFNGERNPLIALGNLIVVGLFPFAFSFGPFLKQLPQILGRLFPFKRGLTHAYWAPNFWALYNTADKFASVAMGIKNEDSLGSSTSGLVQEIKHTLLPSVSPGMTFLLSLLFMLPILIKLLFFTKPSDSKHVFLRATVLCSCVAYMFGWHVHEKAILMCLIPICLLCLVNPIDAKYAYLLSVVGYFSLFPLLFHIDLLLLRYSLFGAYIATMYSQIQRMHKTSATLNWLECLYAWGFVALPLYEHLLSPLLGLNKTLPFMPLLLTSFYCSLGIFYFFIRYYLYTLDIRILSTMDYTKVKTKSMAKSKPRTKVKQKQKTK